MKKIGIFLNFDPSVKLYKEGLGRLLGNIIKGGVSVGNYYLIACPSWSRRSLTKFFEEENIDLSNIQFIGPKKVPISLVIYQWFLKDRKSKITKSYKYLRKIKFFLSFFVGRSLGRILSLDLFKFICFAIPAFFFLSTLIVFFPFYFAIISLCFLALYLLSKVILKYNHKFLNLLLKIYNNLFFAKKNFSYFKIYENISYFETKSIIKAVNKVKDVEVWFCPTVFWPEFNDIKSTKVVVVPDVVLEEYPIGFAFVSNKIHDRNLEKIRNTIANNEYFITYSENVKNTILIDRFHKTGKNIRVINHGWTDLSQYIDFKVKGDLKKSQITWSNRTAQAYTILNIYSNVKNLPANGFQYIIYSSQDRPNKNIYNLVRAFASMVHENFLSHKLILTCYPSAVLNHLIEEENLYGKVLFFPGISQMDLASLYNSADIAVNPSLAEGGFPFTFSEALSVDTPIVMSDIQVTRQVLSRFSFSHRMLFNPLDITDIKRKMLDCIENRQVFLDNQNIMASEMKSRTWEMVANEYNFYLNQVAAMRRN